MKPSTYFKVTILIDGKEYVTAVQARDLAIIRSSYQIVKVERQLSTGNESYPQGVPPIVTKTLLNRFKIIPQNV